MKQGDLVKLKEGQSWTQEEAEAMGYKSVSEIPEYLEVESTTSIVVCCVPVPAFQAVGISGFGFWQSNFDVVLEAGVPDTIKLMEEAKQLELASIGF